MPEDPKYYAVKADTLMILMVVCILFSMGVVLYLSKDINEMKLDIMEVSKDVEWIEDEAVKTMKFKDEIYKKKMEEK